MSSPQSPGPRGKPVTRRTVLSRRDALAPDTRAAASARIASEVGALLARLPAGSIVALYAPKGSEVDTTALDGALRGRLRVVYPRVIAGDRRLAFGEATIDELVIGSFGLREPPAERTPIELSEVAAFVVPGLAFDRKGGRVGWGRGHYDATLVAASPSAIRIGVAFECQVIDSVPRDPHDVMLHFVVTEAATYRSP